MTGELKMLIGVGVATILVVVGFSFLKGGQEPEVLGDISGVVASPEYYDMGEVPMGDGIVTREYEVTNTTSGLLKLKKISTSCMCTEAKVKTSKEETRFFGMEGHGARIPNVNLEIAPGETALVTVNFDPAAHGPSGVGPFDRVVWLTFSDPAGVVELAFDGIVTR